ENPGRRMRKHGQRPGTRAEAVNGAKAGAANTFADGPIVLGVVGCKIDASRRVRRDSAREKCRGAPWNKIIDGGPGQAASCASPYDQVGRNTHSIGAARNVYVAGGVGGYASVKASPVVAGPVHEIIQRTRP